MRWILKDYRRPTDSPGDTVNLGGIGSILLAIQDPQDLSQLASVMCDQGYEVSECSESADLLEELINFACPKKNFSHQLIIAEVGLPSGTCIEFMEVLGKHEGFPPVILITDQDDEDIRSLTHLIGSAAVFQKPFEMEDLVSTAIEIIRESRDG